jgi:hypothetical protein
MEVTGSLENTEMVERPGLNTFTTFWISSV